jgi:hypothetical protein
MGGPWQDSVGNLQPQPSIFPNQLAFGVRSIPDGSLKIAATGMREDASNERNSSRVLSGD